VTVPAVIVTLRLQNVISDRAAQRKLELIEGNTAEELLIAARRVLDRLGPAAPPTADPPDAC
jgi:hypothetical protein